MPETEKSPALRRAEIDYQYCSKKELQLISSGLICWLAAAGLQWAQIELYQENLVRVGVGLLFVALLVDFERQSLLENLDDIEKYG